MTRLCLRVSHHRSVNINIFRFSFSIKPLKGKKSCSSFRRVSYRAELASFAFHSIRGTLQGKAPFSLIAFFTSLELFALRRRTIFVRMKNILFSSVTTNEAEIKKVAANVFGEEKKKENESKEE